MNWQRFWQKKSLANSALLPLSALYYAITSLRRLGYQSGIFRIQKAPRPVVVIGNINIGGAGKTPLVIALGKLLAEHGIRYAVVSKGYGGSFSTPTIVTTDSPATLVGDEPLLIKLKCDCPLIVAKSRLEACRLVAKHFPETQVILTDDGLQHYPLASDIKICVINSQMGLGNGYVLPAGGLREPPKRLAAMDFVVYNGDNRQPYHYLLAERGWQHINENRQRQSQQFSALASDNLALSGIAHPHLFFKRLEAMGVACDHLALKDHHAFRQSDLPADKTLLMTEKDWVKAKAFKHSDAWFLKTEALLSAPLKDDFLQTVEKLITSAGD